MSASEYCTTPDTNSIAMLHFRTIEEMQQEYTSQKTPSEAVDQVDMEALTEQIRHQIEKELSQKTKKEITKKEDELRSSLSRTLEVFAKERKQYFERLERQVVRLTLAIAEKIVRREVSLDPLLLAGAVRVVLDKVGDRSPVVLRIPSREEAAWRTQFADASSCPSLEVDDSLQQGDCVLQTEVGTVDLSVRAQLMEIETTFFDLLNRRPAQG